MNANDTPAARIIRNALAAALAVRAELTSYQANADYQIRACRKVNAEIKRLRAALAATRTAPPMLPAR